MDFDRCIFEVLGKLGAQQLSTICTYINGKVAVMENEIRRELSIVDQSQNQVVSLMENLTTGIDSFNDKIRQSAIFDVARTLSPNCAPIGEIFGGAFDVSELTAQATADVTFIAKQITSKSAQANNLLNHILDQTAALKDICTITQIMLQEGTKDPNVLKETAKRLVS
jgi:hypothetical protein